MNEGFNFENLFVLDLANNHQGNVDHALNIIRGMASVIKKQDVRAAIKFQFRQLDSFIHPAHQENSDNKHVPRFLSTQLNPDQFKTLKEAVSSEGLLTMCTPFDEASVDLICQMGFDLIKVASCSARDWPLLEKIAATGLPTIFSTGGLTLKDIDNLVSFFDHRGVDYAMMHCVSVYPTPFEACQLNRIDVLHQRYPDCVVGWSTHEVPDATSPVQVAVAKGAKMFERHIGIATETIQLNAYSSTPEQVDRWLSAYHEAIALCGTTDKELPLNDSEQSAITGLQRGVYARKIIKKGTSLTAKEVYFAMPYTRGQLSSGQWSQDIVTLEALEKDAPLMTKVLTIPENADHQILKTAIHEVKALLNEAHIALNSEFEVEYSHHYGVEKFYEVGAVIINCINREYCKKIIVQLPGQRHPSHFHQRKEETFQVLYGTLKVTLDGVERFLKAGETCLVQPGVWHSFDTETGCVFEEISTTHYNDDSFYREKAINRMKREDRKTLVENWGRYQLKPSPLKQHKASLKKCLWNKRGNLAMTILRNK